MAFGVQVLWTAILVVAFKMRVKTVNDVIESKIISRSVGHACAFKIASYELSEILAQLIETKFDEIEEDDSD